MWRICCWRARSAGGARSRSGRRSARAADASSGNCLRRACCCRWRARWPGRCSASWGFAHCSASIPPTFRASDEEGSLVVVDWRVLAFTILAAAVTGILFGLIPALQTSRPDLSATLKESGGRSGTGLRHNKARTVLVVTEVALAVVLLVGSALLIRTSIALGAVKPGFDAGKRAHHAHVDQRAAIHEVGGSGPDAARGRRATARCSGSADRECRMLRATGRRLWAAVHRDGASAHGRPVSRRRRTGKRSRPAISRCSRSRCCADAPSPIAMTAGRLRWW